ncbi:MAG: zf-HC2 domain-containing protein [Bryobacteraceae bacterium]
MMQCSNPALFTVSDDWERMGIATTEQVRQELLWRLASATGTAKEIEAHAPECRECKALLASFLRLTAAAREGEARTFAACPGAAAVAAFQYGELGEPERARIEAHVKACTACGEEAAWIARTAAERNVVEMPRPRWPIFAAVAAAVALLAFLPIWRQPSPASPFAGLAQMPALDRAELNATLSHPERSRALLDSAITAFEAREYRAAEASAHTILVASPDDASALFIVALARLQEGDMISSENAMYASERAPPITHYRCWAALQLALLTGNRARIEMECRHLDGDPAYADRTSKIRSALERQPS